MTHADSTNADFQAFQAFVLDSPVLQKELRDITDWGTFVDRALALGAENGYAFTADDLTQALQESRRAWIERWIL